MKTRLENIADMNKDHPIGTQYTTRGKRPDLCTVTDILKTYNNGGELVKTSYVSTHQFLGQTVMNHDVCAVTIARGLTS